MRVQVTEEHIKAGKPWDSYQCPVALALQDRLDVDEEAVVADGNLLSVVMKYGDYDTAVTPPVVSRFMADYDARRRVLPFAFEVEFVMDA
jgi:hypothetical protein